MHPICTLRRSGTQTDVEEQEQTMSQALISAGVRTSGGEGGIRTLGTGVSPYNGLANRRIRPLCHLSGVRIYSLPRRGRQRLTRRGGKEAGIRMSAAGSSHRSHETRHETSPDYFSRLVSGPFHTLPVS